MQLTSKFNERIFFLLCATDIFSKYAWVVLLTDNKENAITNAFQKHLHESGRKSNIQNG